MFLTDEFLEGKPILSIIDELMKTLEGYPISKSKQHRLKMLMDDINSNRHLVQSIFKRMGDAQDKNEIFFILKQLVGEELLSLEQFKQHSELEDYMDLPAIALKRHQSYERVKFLPRKFSDLKNTLQTWLGELAETGKSEGRNKVAAVLAELLRCIPRSIYHH